MLKIESKMIYLRFQNMDSAVSVVGDVIEADMLVADDMGCAYWYGSDMLEL